MSISGSGLNMIPALDISRFKIQDWVFKIQIQDWLFKIQDWVFKIQDWVFKIQDWVFKIQDWVFKIEYSRLTLNFGDMERIYKMLLSYPILIMESEDIDFWIE